MTDLMKSTTVSVSIKRNPKTVYEFVRNLENFPKWAKMFCVSIKQRPGRNDNDEWWTIETTQGSAKIRMTKKNEFGILDHYVSPTPDVELLVPMRVVPNRDDGSEVMLTVFQTPDMPDNKFTEDIGLVNHDLRELKRVLEEISDKHA